MATISQETFLEDRASSSRMWPILRLEGLMCFVFLSALISGPGVAQLLRCCANSRKVPGSIPGHVTGDFFRGIRQVHVPGVDSAP
jgi:hypothetical protein